MNPNNFGDLFRQVTRMRKDIEKTQEELKTRYVEAQAGGDLIQITLNGQQDVMKVTLSPKLFEDAKTGKVDVGLVEDLVMAAVNQGIEKSKTLMKAELEKATGGMGLGQMLPGLF